MPKKFPFKASRKRILLAVTSPLSCVFFRGTLQHLQNNGFDVTLVSSPGALLDSVAFKEGAATRVVAMEREIKPVRDLISLWRMYGVMWGIRPTLVDVSTPKAGLLGGLAAFLARVPNRIYTLRGLRLETASGWKRKILWLTEWMACRCAHHVVCNSPSLRKRAIELKLVEAHKASVLQNGSRGVDVEHFHPKRRKQIETKSLRQALGIAEDQFVIGFVGRFVKDKGIRELVQAFQQMSTSYPEARLLLVGDFETGDPVEEAIQGEIESNRNIIRTGFIGDAAPYYALMNILALPTYREGFPGVPLEAQASGVPVVTTMATGAIDSVVNGETGFVVPVGDATTLAQRMTTLLNHPELCERMGADGRKRMEREFRREDIWRAQTEMYQGMIGKGSRENSEKRRNVLSKVLSIETRRPAATGWIKRGFDLAIAGFILLMLSPVLAFLWFLAWAFLGSPVLFRQQRPGLHGIPFTCLKFRTMTDARDADGRLLPDEKRLPAFGKFLRAASLDELPELINVLRGDMSLVGPRPLLVEYLDRYTPEQKRRHEVRPGITGWAQVNGRNALDWKRKFELDVWYVDHQSLWLDLKILFKTLWQVVCSEGISQPGHATMPQFLGGAGQERGNG